MAVASPTCARCKGPAVYIGIGGGAEPVCRVECAGKCVNPMCQSSAIEPFVTWSYYSFTRNPPGQSTYHCRDCGRVWVEAVTP